MSLILDALRKSEQERRQSDPLMVGSVGGEVVMVPRPRLGGRVARFSLAAVGLAFGAYWLFAVPNITPSTRLLEAPKAAAEPAGAVALPATQGRNETVAEIRPAPELTTNPFVAAAMTKSVEVRDLAKEARVEPRAAVARQEQVARAAPAPSPALATEAKFLRAMPPEFQRALPELTVNIHIYAPREADRILYINNRQYHAGDKVRDDLVIEEIVEDGAVLSFRGQRFKLARPS